MSKFEIEKPPIDPAKRDELLRNLSGAVGTKPPEPKTQTAVRLAQSVQARISMLAANKTAANGGTRTINKQDIMESAILEYLEREETKFIR